MSLLYIPPPGTGENLWQYNQSDLNKIELGADVDGINAAMPGNPEFTFGFGSFGGLLTAAYKYLSGNIQAVFGVLNAAGALFIGYRLTETVTGDDCAMNVDETYTVNINAENLIDGLSNSVQMDKLGTNEITYSTGLDAVNQRIADAQSDTRAISIGNDLTLHSQDSTTHELGATDGTDVTILRVTVQGSALILNGATQFAIGNNGQILTNQSSPLSGFSLVPTARLQFFDETGVSLGYARLWPNP